MKKFSLGFITTSLIATTLIMGSPMAQATDVDQSPIQNVNEQGLNLSSQYEPKAMTITDENGQVLYDYHGETSSDPASITKLMTLYLTFDALNNEKISKDQKIKITSDYEKMSALPNLSTVKLKKGQTYTIDEIMKQVSLASSNPATLILGEKIDGSTSKFTDRMNEKAKELGMNHTHFTNPSGASNDLLKPYEPKKYKDEAKTKTTSQDISLLIHSLLKKHPEVINYTKLTHGKQYNQDFETTNLSLKGEPEEYLGTDGLKTGTSDEGYSIALTNNQDHLRLNATILDVKPYPSEQAKHVRNQIANHMIEDLRKEYTYTKVMSKGTHKIDGKEITVSKDLYDTVPKNKDKWSLKVNKDNQVYVSYPRKFIKGSHYPHVNVDKMKSSNTHHPFINGIKNFFKFVCIVFIVVCIFLFIVKKKGK